MFKLIDLPYDSLGTAISSETLSFHHGKHLNGYVTNLNKLIVGTEYEGKTLEEIVMSSFKNNNRAVFNNAGQILNHELYFAQFRLGGKPLGERNLEAQIKKQWGSVEAFQSEFISQGVFLFGSGWVWLSLNSNGELEISQEEGARNPIIMGRTPILTFDVWEHAYYLDYQNRRADHLSSLWQVVDWTVIEGRFDNS